MAGGVAHYQLYRDHFGTECRLRLITLGGIAAGTGVRLRGALSRVETPGQLRMCKWRRLVAGVESGDAWPVSVEMTQKHTHPHPGERLKGGACCHLVCYDRRSLNAALQDLI